ncbi:unnamed protein product [Ostreobium quekettii]|uniref:Uncharacterized protein n=1 Tax=Ostreobium quekettii TaxID=121088 RepID=A0A8S1IYF6_9CHLO|nr:unnamed protein product [Ostreobium quekettii]|eukprot:evm.model.scf_750.5 EVM.evm.TU.scf_750.5   scf_750:42604-43578(+)
MVQGNGHRFMKSGQRVIQGNNCLLSLQWSMQLPSSDEPGGQQRAASTKMEQHSCPEDTSSYRQYLEDLQDVRESFEARQSRGDRLHPREQASLRALQRVVGREDPASSQSPSELGTDDDVGVALEHGGRDGHARARAAKSRRSNQRLAHVRPAEGATGSRKCKAAMSKQERKNKDIAEAFISLENNRLSNGGPVSQVPVLHCIPHLGGSHVLEGVFWCEQSKVLLSDLGALDRRKVRFFLGEASWSPGQLEAELKMGSWIMARAPVGTLDLMDQGYWSSFEGASVERQHKDPSFLWEKLMSGLGGEYAIMARMPPWAAAFGNDM